MKTEKPTYGREKLSFSLKRPKDHFLLYISVYCAHFVVYINYEERQQGITRMNVVACGNKKI